MSEDTSYLFAIHTNDGTLQLVIKPTFLESYEGYNWTIDEYIAKGSPTWLTRLPD